MKSFGQWLLWVLSLPFRLIVWLISLPFLFLGWLFHPVTERIKESSIFLFFTDEPEEHDFPELISATFSAPELLLEQLEDLRGHLLRILLALIITISLSFYFTDQIVAFLAQPIGGLQKLQAIEVTESISVFMKVALMAGLAIGSPYVAFEVWWFIAPGLRPAARLSGLLTIPMALIFFLSGMAFAYYFMLPSALPFLLDFLGIQTNLRPDSYFEFVTSLMFWIGVSFEFPLLVFGLSGIGLLNPKLLLQQWRLAVILIAVLAAIITPTIDPINMALVMGPMIGLYFLSIFFSFLARLGQKPTTAAVE